METEYGGSIKRRTILREFEHFKRDRDTRTMEQICTQGASGFELQVQQQFLQEFIKKYDNETRAMLMYHSLGAGKTLSAIIMAEEFIKKNPNFKVTVILPARLRSNFTDELMSPATGYKYLSEIDYNIYIDPATPATTKRRLRNKFLTNVEKVYTIVSFEKMRSLALKADAQGKNLMQWAHEFSHDRFFIVDEIHNLFSTSYKLPQIKELEEGQLTKNVGRVSAANTVVFKFLVKYGAASSRFIMLTATPIFDNVGQLLEVVKVLTPNSQIPRKLTIRDTLKLLKGKVSYFPGTSPAVFLEQVSLKFI